MYKSESDFFNHAYEKDEDEIDQLHVEIEKLKSDMEKMKQLAKDRDALLHDSETQRLKLQEKTSDQAATIQRLQKDIETKDKRIDELHGEYLSMKQENKALRDHVESNQSSEVDTKSQMEVRIIENIF
jgi:chromosome segregation ATPase